jgi:hypothetical protein
VALAGASAGVGASAVAIASGTVASSGFPFGAVVVVVRVVQVRSSEIAPLKRQRQSRLRPKIDSASTTTDHTQPNLRWKILTWSTRPINASNNLAGHTKVVGRVAIEDVCGGRSDPRIDLSSGLGASSRGGCASGCGWQHAAAACTGHHVAG